MSFLKKMRGELIDIIEFLDSSQNTIVHRFERFQNEIKNGAKLIVREGQQAVFISEGRIADVFTPGTYTLYTQNLPILSTLQGWKYGFNSPFKAEVYFVTTKTFLNQRWGTKNPIILHDDRFGMIEIRAYGTYTFKTIEAGRFIREIVGTTGTFETEHIAEQLRSVIVTRFTDAIGEAKLPVESYAANLNELSTAIFSYMKDDFADYGMDVTKFLIENVSMPDEIKKEIFELSRLNAVDLDKLTKMKTAKAIGAAANNPSGMAGTGVGMGAGFAMANQMARAMMRQNDDQHSRTTIRLSGRDLIQSIREARQQTPPPITPPITISYYVALNGQQAGPFDMNTLKQMATDGQITRETLVWKSGMSDWEKSGSQSDLNDLWAQIPPPIPGKSV